MLAFVAQGDLASDDEHDTRGWPEFFHYGLGEHVSVVSAMGRPVRLSFLNGSHHHGAQRSRLRYIVWWQSVWSMLPASFPRSCPVSLRWLIQFVAVLRVAAIDSRFRCGALFTAAEELSLSDGRAGYVVLEICAGFCGGHFVSDPPRVVDG